MNRSFLTIVAAIAALASPAEAGDWRGRHNYARSVHRPVYQAPVRYYCYQNYSHAPVYYRYVRPVDCRVVAYPVHPQPHSYGHHQGYYQAHGYGYYREYGRVSYRYYSR